MLKQDVCFSPPLCKPAIQNTNDHYICEQMGLIRGGIDFPGAAAILGDVDAPGARRAGVTRAPCRETAPARDLGARRPGPLCRIRNLGATPLETDGGVSSTVGRRSGEQQTLNWVLPVTGKEGLKTAPSQQATWPHLTWPAGAQLAMGL